MTKTCYNIIKRNAQGKEKGPNTLNLMNRNSYNSSLKESVEERLPTITTLPTWVPRPLRWKNPLP